MSALRAHTQRVFALCVSGVRCSDGAALVHVFLLLELQSAVELSPLSLDQLSASSLYFDTKMSLSEASTTTSSPHFSKVCIKP